MHYNNTRITDRLFFCNINQSNSFIIELLIISMCTVQYSSNWSHWTKNMGGQLSTKLQIYILDFPLSNLYIHFPLQLPGRLGYMFNQFTF